MTVHRHSFFQVCLTATLALVLGCGIGDAISDSSAPPDDEVQAALDRLDRLERCQRDTCARDCLPHWWARVDAPPQCGVTCSDSPCQPLCAETPDGVEAETEGWCLDYGTERECSATPIDGGAAHTGLYCWDEF